MREFDRSPRRSEPNADGRVETVARRALSPVPVQGEPARRRAHEVVRRFGEVVALDGVSLTVRAGAIHGLLGPNGAGKTTLMRILTGLVEADTGKVSIAGCDPALNTRALRDAHRPRPVRRPVSVPASLRNRESPLLRTAAGTPPPSRARPRGRGDRAGRASPTPHTFASGVYSHGMQKRLAVARGLITDPTVLLVDEATHDLDPEAAENIRTLVRELAARGTAILWTTQRVDEVRGFADAVTLLDHGRVRFAGTVPELMSHALPRRYLLHLARRDLPASGTPADCRRRSTGWARSPQRRTVATITIFLPCKSTSVLGEALARIRAAGYELLGCRDERSEVEDGVSVVDARSRRMISAAEHAPGRWSIFVEETAKLLRIRAAGLPRRLELPIRLRHRCARAPPAGASLLLRRASGRRVEAAGIRRLAGLLHAVRGRSGSRWRHSSRSGSAASPQRCGRSRCSAPWNPSSRRRPRRRPSSWVPSSTT